MSKANIKLVRMELSHLKALSESDQIQNMLRLRGVGFVMLADDQPVAAAGLAILWGRVAKAWAIIPETTRLDYRLMVIIRRSIRRILPILRVSMELERIEAETKDDPKFCTWLKDYGFMAEGMMAKYRDSQTYWRFAWTN